MKEEYDFTNAEQGRFYRPLEELDIPIYLDKEVKKKFLENLRDKNSRFSLNADLVTSTGLTRRRLSENIAISCWKS